MKKGITNLDNPREVDHSFFFYFCYFTICNFSNVVVSHRLMSYIFFFNPVLQDFYDCVVIISLFLLSLNVKLDLSYSLIFFNT